LLKFSEFALKFPLAKETDAARADFLVELRGLCAGRPARSNRCKSDAMKE
jgi:hypothetical protein